MAGRPRQGSARAGAGDIKKRRKKAASRGDTTMQAQGATEAVAVAGRSFCFTGRGQTSRTEMMRAAVARGGVVHTRVTRRTDYLVVGSRGSRRWKQPYCGTKTAAALRLIAMGGGIRIVGEEAFRRAVAQER